MQEDQRAYVVRQLIAEHLKSPSLRHIRDAYAVNKLADKIVRRLSGSDSSWTKWNSSREALLESALQCWIPPEALRDHLNGMHGPALTLTDVIQRMRDFHEKAHNKYPDERLRQGCLAIYEDEGRQGTELPAIIGAIQEYVEREDERLRIEREAAWRVATKAAQDALEQRFLSGADSKWTPVGNSKTLYCRINGRSYRLSPTKDKKWDLHRIQSLEDANGVLIGTYRYRGDVRKVLQEVAYQTERYR